MVRNQFGGTFRQRSRRRFKGGLRNMMFTRYNQEYQAPMNNNSKFYFNNGLAFNPGRSRGFIHPVSMPIHNMDQDFEFTPSQFNLRNRKNKFALSRFYSKGLLGFSDNNRNFSMFRNNFLWNNNQPFPNMDSMKFMRGGFKNRVNNKNSNPYRFNNKSNFTNSYRRRFSRNRNQKALSEKELNQQLESYMGGDLTESLLDNQLDAYFRRDNFTLMENDSQKNIL